MGTAEAGTAEVNQDEAPAESTARELMAMNRVIAEQADMLDAMHRDEVGSVSFYWGTPGKGEKLKGGSAFLI